MTIPLQAVFDLLWSMKIPSKFLIFSWRLLLDRLPTKNNLLIRGVINNIRDAKCVLSSSNEENLFHLFFLIASFVWSKLGAWLGCNLHSHANQCALFLFLSGKLQLTFGKEKGEMFWITTCWIIGGRETTPCLMVEVLVLIKLSFLLNSSSGIGSFLLNSSRGIG